MMFDTLQGLKIPEGVVTQIAKGGVILWAVQNDVPDIPNKPIILEVEKITSNTYAGETTYNNEEFLLLDIYPKTNGTVNVTYGGLTKTITDTSGAEQPNAQQVFFGTFNGVSDSVATPASGRLTIDGDYYAFGHGYFSYTNKFSKFCNCITSVLDLGVSTEIPDYAFTNSAKLANIHLTDGIVSVNEDVMFGCSAFKGCTNLTSITVSDENLYYSSENGVLFNKDKTELIYCPNFDGAYIIPNSVKSIMTDAFRDCTRLTSITFTNIEGWQIKNESSNSLLATNVDVTNPENNVLLLTDTYTHHWKRN